MKTWKEILSDEQHYWVEEQLRGKNIIFCSVHGSWLYGLNREGSDVDVKAIYLPSFQELLLGESIKTTNKKNDNLDIEIEIKSLPSFLKSAQSCDTNCIDMLWTPPEKVISAQREWYALKNCRQDLLSKNMKGLIGYIKTQTHRYSNKIQRFEEMSTLLEELQFIKNHVKLKDTTLPEIVERNNFKYIKFVTQVTDHEQQYIEVCGKKYILSWETKLLKDALVAELDRYGKRTQSGKDKGMDVKSLSHALRVLYQLKELILTKGITFPLKEAENILKVKLGQYNNETEVISLIDNLFEEVMELLQKSDLPEESSIGRMLELLEMYYAPK